MTDTFRRDITQMYAYTAQCNRLETLVPALYDVFRRNGDVLSGISASYRLVSTDTGFSGAFALDAGKFTELPPAEPVDVTITGKEAHLLAVFQRKMNPATAMLTRRVRVNGSKAALMQLAAFL